MKTLQVTLKFNRPGYIAEPYRIELHKLVEIQKTSGMMRARSEKKKRECLETWLRANGMTFDQYKALEKMAKEPFFKNAQNYIIIPASRIHACLYNANDEAPSRLKINNIRVAIRPSDFVTTKKSPDGTWERFAVVKNGTGQTLSNQRGLRTSQFIENFEAKGTIEHDPEMVDQESIKNLLDYAGQAIGIGSSRKMGWGKFTVTMKKV